MKNMDLSIRMKAVAGMVVQGSKVADIGCDHAFIPIYLKKNNIAKKIIASDVRKGPLDIAKRNVASEGLSEFIDVRMGDGLKSIKPGEVDTIVIAGMGGMLIIRILSESPEILNSIRHLVLQPQSDVMEVRRYLDASGWIITEEKMVLDAGKYYVIMGCNRIDTDKENSPEDDVSGVNEVINKETFLMYGKYMLMHRDLVLYTYLKEEQKKISNIYNSLSAVNTEHTRERAEELQYKMKLIDKALEYFAD